MTRFRGGLIFEAHIFLYHSTLGSRVIKRREESLEHSLNPHARSRRRFSRHLHTRPGRLIPRLHSTLKSYYRANLRVWKHAKRHRPLSHFVDLCDPLLQTRCGCPHNQNQTSALSKVNGRRPRRAQRVEVCCKPHPKITQTGYQGMFGTRATKNQLGYS